MVIDRRKEGLVAAVMVAPNLIGLLVFMVVPTVISILMSFTDWNLLNTSSFIGLANFKEAFSDPLFWKTLNNTVVYVFF